MSTQTKTIEQRKYRLDHEIVSPESWIAKRKELTFRRDRFSREPPRYPPVEYLDAHKDEREVIEDVVSAHLLAYEHAPGIGFRKYIISATTPFLPDLRVDAPLVVRQRVPDYEAEYERRGWKMFPSNRFLL